MKKITSLKFFMMTLTSIILSSNLTYSQVIQPSGGYNYDAWELEKNVQIKWNNNSFESTEDLLSISIWDGNTGTTYVLANEINPENNSYSWEIPSDFPIGSNFRVKISQNNKVICNDNFVSISTQSSSSKRSTIENNTTFVEKQINIYPNPTSDFITFVTESNLNGEISIYNVLGEKVYSEKVNNSEQHNQINVEFLTNGTYILVLKTDYGIISKSFNVIR